jgi:hypothetical protein
MSKLKCFACEEEFQTDVVFGCEFSMEMSNGIKSYIVNNIFSDKNENEIHLCQ